MPKAKKTENKEDIKESIKQDAEQTGDREFKIQRIYIANLSFESPFAPDIFKQDWAPKVNLDVGSTSNSIGPDVYNITLRLTVTVQNGEENAFLIEVQQAGIFTIKGFNEDQLKHTLASFCPNILYPYAREVVTDAAMRGGFPQLILAPINFDAIYAQHLKEEAGKAGEEGKAKGASGNAASGEATA